jgi:glutaredoxin 3
MAAVVVVVYSAGYCAYCERTKALLERKAVEFTEIMVDQDPARRAEMVQRTGRRTVPQIFIGETHVGGFEDIYRLEREGKLDALLADGTTDGR